MKPERDWLLQDLAGLKEESMPEAALAAVRARVTSEVAVRPEERGWWRWVWAPALMMAAVVVVLVVGSMRVPRERPVQVAKEQKKQAPVAEVTAAVITNKVPMVPGPELRKRVVRKVSVPEQETQFVKLITDDPDVVIYWSMNGTE